MPRNQCRLLMGLKRRGFASRLKKLLPSAFHVEICEDGVQMMEQLAQGKWDVVIADYLFAKEDWKEITKLCKQHEAALAYAVYSVQEHQRLKRLFKRKRAIDYLIYDSSTIGFIEKIKKLGRWSVLKYEMIAIEKELRELQYQVQLLAKKASHS